MKRHRGKNLSSSHQVHVDCAKEFCLQNHLTLILVFVIHHVIGAVQNAWLKRNVLAWKVTCLTKSVKIIKLKIAISAFARSVAFPNANLKSAHHAVQACDVKIQKRAHASASNAHQTQLFVPQVANALMSLLGAMESKIALMMKRIALSSPHFTSHIRSTTVRWPRWNFLIYYHFCHSSNHEEMPGSKLSTRIPNKRKIQKTKNVIALLRQVEHQLSDIQKLVAIKISFQFRRWWRWQTSAPILLHQSQVLRELRSHFANLNELQETRRELWRMLRVHLCASCWGSWLFRRKPVVSNQVSRTKMSTWLYDATNRWEESTRMCQVRFQPSMTVSLDDLSLSDSHAYLKSTTMPFAM